MKKTFTGGPAIACAITIVRIILAPFFVAKIRQKNFFSALVISVIAGLSDFFDGKVARKFNWQSKFGANLDPIADKVFELTAINSLSQPGMLPKQYQMIFNLRNVAQLMSFPLLYIIFPRSFKVKPKLPAKIATATGFTSILLVLLNKITDRTCSFLDVTQKTTVFLSSILEVWILVTYIPRLINIILRRHDTFE